jgi:LytR cell envelope-related transcriptional attenuator
VVAKTSMRRPLPAVIALAALLLLTAIVWWRVLNRDSSSSGSTSSSCSAETHAVATLPAPNLVIVQVLNSTNRQGIADKVRSTLVNDGFNSPDPAANDKQKMKIPGVAQIRYGSKGRNGAKLLHYYFPKAKLVATKAKSATVIVSLGEGYQGVVTSSAVTAALQQKQIELRTAAPGPSPSPTC